MRGFCFSEHVLLDQARARAHNKLDIIFLASGEWVLSYWVEKVYVGSCFSALLCCCHAYVLFRSIGFVRCFKQGLCLML